MECHDAPAKSADLAVRVEERHCAGLDLLLAAHDYAADLGRDLWDFAVEIGELRRVRLYTADLRWLVFKGFIEHAYERWSLNGREREFRRDGRLAFRRESCFVLTEAGVAMARRICRISKRGATPGAPPPSPNGSVQRLVPTWDAARQQLLLGDTVVKEFKVPAANQEQVLAAFEEEGWPIRIDDPLPPRADQAPKQRLHTTVNALNRNQRHRLIRFSGDGRGEGIRWELLRPGTNGHGPVLEDA